VAKKKKKYFIGPVRPRHKSGPKKGKFMSNRALAARKARKSSGKKKKTKKRNPTALAKRGKTTMAKKKKKKSRRRNGGGRGSRGIPTSEIKELLMGGAIYGYIKEPDADSDMRASIVENMNKAPIIGNRAISDGLVLYLIDKHIYGNKYIRMTAKAALVTGAVRFGSRGFKLDDKKDAELKGHHEDDWEEAADVTEQGEEVSGHME